jgi:two-component system sensor histidine kinase VicK
VSKLKPRRFNTYLETAEDIFRSIVEASPYPIYVCTGQDMIVSVANRATLQAWGKDSAVIGRPFAEALPELEGQPFLGLLQNVYRTGKAYTAKNDRADLIADGRMQTFYFDFTYQAMRDSTGNITGVVCFATDVTGLERARQAEEESKQILRNIVKQAPVGICIIKGDPFYVEEVNDTFLTLIHRKRNDFDNQSYWQTIPEAADTYEPITRHVALTGESYYATEHEIKLLDDGMERIIYADFVYEPIRNPDGPTDTLLIVATDVTEKVKARKELQRLNEDLAAANEEYAAVNKELIDINQELQHTQEDLRELNNQLEERVAARTNELSGANEELAAINEELSAANEELQQTQASLQELNNELEARVFSRTRDLFESEQRFRAMAEGSGILIAVADESSNATYFSKAWTDLTGKSLEDLIGFGWVDLVHPEDKENFLSIYLSAFKNQLPFKGEFRILSKEGEYRWLLANAPPRLRPDGSFAGYISSCTDITEQKQDEQRKNDFIGMVSHELKTPLTSLNAYLQMLHTKARKAEDSFTVGALNKSVSQVKKMTTMINGFLNVSRLESGKIQIDKQRFDMANLLKEIEAETLAMISSHHIVFDPTMPTYISADRDKIGHVLHNFISNAVKYSPQGSTINVACANIGSEAQVSVKDRGIGIRREDTPNIFDRYYRVNNKQTQTISGFGIGLYLCAEIIKRHDGGIWVESEFGEGSTFYFSLHVD